MKVLFIARYYYPHIGGVEKHVRSISTRLRKKSYQVIVVTELLSGTKKLECENGIRIIRFSYPKVKFLGLVWIWIWFLKNWLVVAKSDLIHIHDVFIWYLPMRFLFPLKKVFITFHGWEGKYPITIKDKLLRKIAEKLTIGNICVGDYFSKWYGTKPTYVTYGSVNLIKNSRRSRGSLASLSRSGPLAAKFKVQNHSLKFKILFIGRLEKDTGLPIYLKTLKILNLKRQEVVFLGDGSLRQEAEKFGEVKGFVKDPTPYLTKARFIFTSGYLSILEALAVQKLVFAVYDNPIKKDILKMTPFSKWIIIENKPEKLVQKINYFLTHPQKERQIVNEAYHWVRNQTWQKVADLYIKLWEQ